MLCQAYRGGLAVGMAVPEPCWLPPGAAPPPVVHPLAPPPSARRLPAPPLVEMGQVRGAAAAAAAEERLCSESPNCVQREPRGGEPGCARRGAALGAAGDPRSSGGPRVGISHQSPVKAGAAVKPPPRPPPTSPAPQRRRSGQVELRESSPPVRGAPRAEPGWEGGEGGRCGGAQRLILIMAYK